MDARRLAAAALSLATATLCAAGQTASQSSPQSATPAPQSSPVQPSDQTTDNSAASSSPSSKGSQSTGTKQHGSGHHVQVPIEETPTELTQAETAIQKKDFAAAEPLLRKAVEQDPKSYVAWFDLGFVQNAVGKVDDSIASYRKAVEAKPDVFESNLNLGLQLAKTGQPDAEKFLRAATRLKPTSHAAEAQYRAWVSLGRVLQKSAPDEALEAFNRAAALQPKEAEPHLAAGILLEQSNKFADAEQEYKQALALDPKSYNALTGLANIYIRGRRFPEAEDYLHKVLALQPDYAAAHMQLGVILAAEEKYDDAIAEMQAGIKLAPQDASAQRELADLYYTAGKNEQAESAYRALLGATPNDAQLHQGLGRALMRQRKFSEAQQEFLSAVKLKPDLGDAYGDLAFAANENKDYALTIKALDMRAGYIPEVAMTYFLRASAWDHLHDVKQASANYHLFLDTAGGRYPDQEWQAKHRLIAIEPQK